MAMMTDTPLAQEAEGLRFARDVLRIEADALDLVRARLDVSIARAADLVFRCPGGVIVTGMGKAGLVGQKLAATLASTGTRAYPLHPAEAIGAGTEQAIAARADLDPTRFFDVSYDSLVADPIATLRSIADHFGLDFSPGFETNARRHLAEHPQGRRGAHRYGLADFGLDRDTIQHHFATYRAWTADRGIATGGAA